MRAKYRREISWEVMIEAEDRFKEQGQASDVWHV
jgi:hypothetical protein